MGRALRRFVRGVQLACNIIILYSLIFVHGFVGKIKSIVIAKLGLHFLLDDPAHDSLELVAHGIQKLMLIINFLLRERSHGNQLVQEPLVSLSQ